MSAPKGDPRALLEPLSLDEQRILRILAVIGEPVALRDLQEILTHLKWRDERDRTFLSQRATRALRTRLLGTRTIVRSEQLLLCVPELRELLTRDTLAEGSFAAIVIAAEQVIPMRETLSWDRNSELRQLRRLRFALYTDDATAVLALLGISLEPFGLAQVRDDQVATLVPICTQPLDRRWLAGLSPALRLLALVPPVRQAALALRDCADLYQTLELLAGPLTPADPGATVALAEQRLLRGDLDGLPALLHGQTAPGALALLGWLALLRGDGALALDCFETAVQSGRRLTRKRKLILPGLWGVFHLLALLRRGERADYEQAGQLASQAPRADDSNPLALVFHRLLELTFVLSGRVRLDDCRYLGDGGVVPRDPLALLFQALARHWLGQSLTAETRQALLAQTRAAAAGGYLWYAHEAAGLLRETAGAADAPLPPEAGAPLSEWIPLARLLTPRASWQIALEALRGLGTAPADGTAAPAGGDGDRRLAWLLTLNQRLCLLEPREQKRNRQGGWTAGRAVALQRLAEQPEEFPYLTPQDRTILAALVVDRERNWSGYEQTRYRLDLDRALWAAIGHPLVIRPDAPDTPVELLGSGPVLNVARQGPNLLVSLEPAPPEDRALLAVAETPQRIRLTRFEPAHREIARILGPRGLTVPTAGEAPLLDGIAAIAPLVTVHSDLDAGAEPPGAVTVAADPRPRLQLTPTAGGLALDLRVQPFGDAGGPRLRPGQGRATLLAELGGQTLRCVRELPAERQAAQAVRAACPALDDGAPDWNWTLDDLESALTTLEQLQTLGDAVVLEWPQGQPLSLAREAQLGQFHVAVQSRADWLELQGELRLDDGRVLAMGELLDLAAASGGRFVRLGEREFLALSHHLRRRLERLRTLTDEGRFHPLAAPAVAEALDGLPQADAPAWQELLTRLAALRDLEPELPSTLQAALRDYQLEGYRWLARLAHWGAGACLADDMGLGKTVQALALILARAPAGPTLVLAPTSVCGNWLEEARRFAPTLQPQRFGPGDRAAMLSALGPFDLVVCSYGLLQSEGERLAGIRWETIVADEAQAFKNPATKRSQAVMRLQGGFRMIATGTPVENRLGELWNLFRFINPGLLGSQERFNRRFAAPIEQGGDAVARQRLRQLLRPFILRRVKSEVLSELPPRTEITLRLELSEGEQALYEALRRQALERLAANADTANPGQQRLQLLAEIMRLRRACCHPRLALPDSDLPSAKLEAFAELCDELRDNGHKALVFSQFVDHLSLVRAWLDRRGIRYQYLDGATPEPRRRAAVAAFQAGEGELFLISLRAGGVGLNLTAADYVIHLDPWWNPAVEDQASNRAHRIGQERPVTIYRLVAKDTIEERILALHASKRELADGLLEGTADGGRLSYEEMLALVREMGG